MFKKSNCNFKELLDYIKNTKKHPILKTFFCLSPNKPRKGHFGKKCISHTSLVHYLIDLYEKVFFLPISVMLYSGVHLLLIIWLLLRVYLRSNHRNENFNRISHCQQSKLCCIVNTEYFLELSRALNVMDTGCVQNLSCIAWARVSWQTSGRL